MTNLSGLPSDFHKQRAINAKRLRSEKVRLLYSHVWQPVLAGVFAAAILAIMMRDALDTTLLLTWLFAIVVVSALRLYLASRFLRATAEEQAHTHWLWQFTLGVLVAGCVWGAGGVLMFHTERIEYVAALAIILAGVAAGSVTMLSSVWWMALFFILPIGLPLHWLFLGSSAPTHQFIGWLLLFFILLLCFTSRRLGRVIHDNIALRLSMAAREAQLKESENRYRSIFQHSPLGVLHFDDQGCITDCNDKLLAILGVERSQLLGYRLLSRSADQDVAKAVTAALEKGTGYYEGTYQLPNACVGTPLRAFFNGVHGMGNRMIGGVAIVEDFTERKHSEEIIYRQAYYDALTDLPNRRLFIERLQTLCGDPASERRGGLVMFLDMDRFKLINDTLGHAAGDDLLVQVARRLESCLQNDDMAARLSGDEFVLLALFEETEGDALIAAADRYMETVQQALAGEYRLESRWIEVTPSMGYTCFNAADCDHAEVLKQADTAMYQAKTEGRARRRRYQPWMSDEINKRVAEQAPNLPVDR